MNRRELLKAAPALAAAAARAYPQAGAKGHLKAGLVAYSFRRQLQAKTLTYEDLIRYVADLGLDGLDTTVYWFPDTSDQYLASLRRTAYKHAVSLYSAAVRARLAQPTPELQRAEVENIRKWVDIADKLGATHVRVFGGAIPKGASESQAIAWAVEVLKRGAEYAGSKGIILGVEDDGGLTTTAEPTVEIVKQTDSPWAGINLDTGNFPKNGYAQVALCIPYAVNVHFKAHIASPDGVKEKADWDRLLGMFAKSGYKGYVSIEYEDQDVETALPGLAAELKRGVRKYSA
ncbi:MAG TPA: sugar phosphate isomerase/epimerase family protein [Bryobacteraceae bacterium]|nr:sugar phosphate isomerase/epimerase family protein [Bryobacteraceae bacterium]